MSARKSISNSFTVNTVEDGESAPYYFQEWFAWSNDASTSSVTTPPTISGSWSTSIPAQGSYAYLWRKSIRYVWNENTRQYSGETAQYVRMTGTNGTSIAVKGHVATTSNLPTIHNDGDAYVVDADGHLYMWSDEANRWLDIGQFKGESGKTYYTHIAWATNVNYNSSGVVTSVDGFTIDKSPNDTTHLWMGVLVNEDSSTDSSDALDYTWSYTKGVDGFSVQAQYAPNNDPSSSQIHNTWQDGDLYMRTKQSDETTWSSWHKIVGESGDETDYTFNISKSLTSLSATTAPANCYYNTWQDAPIAPTSTYPYLWMKIVKKTWNESTQSYDSGTARYARVTGDKGDDALTLALDTYAIAFPTDSGYNVESQKTYTVGARMYLGNSTPITITSLTARLDVEDGDVDVTRTSPTNGVVITLGEATFQYNIGVNVTAVCAKGTRRAKIILTAAPKGAKGDNGARGKVGRFFYFGGTFDSLNTTQTFIVNDAQAPYFEHSETVTTQSGTTTIKRYHVFNYDTNGSYTMKQMWAIRNNWNYKPWEAMTNDFKYIITEAIFGAYAHFGANIINKDYRLSQYGYMRGFYDSKVSVNSGTQYIYFDDSDPFGDEDMFSKSENMVANQSLSDYEIPDSTHYVILGNNIEFAPSDSPSATQIENTFTSSCSHYRFKTNSGSWSNSWYAFSSRSYYFALSARNDSAPSTGWNYSGTVSNLVPTEEKPYLWMKEGSGGTPFLVSSPQKSFTIEKGRYYAISIETENYNAGDLNIRIGTKNSYIAITSGSLKKELIGDTLTYYGIFIKQDGGDLTNANLWTNKSGLSFTFEAVYKAQFVPMLCEDLKSGKLVANNIVARGELHADSLYYSMYNEESNNGTIPVEDKSIVSIGTTGVGSVVKLPSPSASKGRKVEVYNYATSWKATWDGATSASKFSCPYGSGLDYRTVDATSKKYVLFYCDGSTWWILRAEN